MVLSPHKTIMCVQKRGKQEARIIELAGLAEKRGKFLQRLDPLRLQPRRHRFRRHHHAAWSAAALHLVRQEWLDGTGIITHHTSVLNGIFIIPVVAYLIPLGKGVISC